MLMWSWLRKLPVVDLLLVELTLLFVLLSLLLGRLVLFFGLLLGLLHFLLVVVVVGGETSVADGSRCALGVLGAGFRQVQRSRREHGSCRGSGEGDLHC
jgi:hypothetical protein